MKYNKRRWAGMGLYCSFNKSDATDDSGNNNNGIISGAVIAKGKIGQCFEFTAATQYIEVADNSTIENNRLNTYALWLNSDAWSGLGNDIVAKGDVAGAVYFASNGTDLTSDHPGDGLGAQTAALPSAGAWHHIIYSKGTAGIYIFVDNVQVVFAANTSTYALNNIAFRIGANSDGVGGDNGFDGKIDEVYIFTTELTPQERAVLYSDGRNVIPKFKKVAHDAI